ncbi:hypothetical protein PoB_003882900 [Plakobranchus ocellatus]|uniref:Uncharacterized protein n=1 Tax=Plakobranchus ocellatus TaxID=259542 RepID=A0AAV4B0V8_9GAST|nr:hypothetical protein PoB_003882900 [Plakobranchus ocellatus]
MKPDPDLKKEANGIKKFEVLRYTIIALVRVPRLSFRFLYMASLEQGDLRLLGPPSGQGAGGGARTRDKRAPADLREDSLATKI